VVPAPKVVHDTPVASPAGMAFELRRRTTSALRTAEPLFGFQKFWGKLSQRCVMQES
jgi:hypothetical protein